jgi:putative peptide zinc metalloprotease protein
MSSFKSADARRFVFNNSITTADPEGSSRNPMIVCEVPASGGTPSRFAIPVPLLQCLRLFNGERTSAEVAAAYRVEDPDSIYSAEKLSHLVETFLVPKRILFDPDRPPGSLEEAPRSSYLYFRLPLLPGRVVYPVARMMSWLFYKPLLLTLLAIAVAAHIYFYGWAVHAHHLDINHFKGRPLIDVTLWAMLAALCHEFGHAAAMARHGCRKLEIGFGLYLHIPVLYTDVSEAWRLPAIERAVVDIGGIYYQCLFIIGFLILLVTQGSPTWAYTIVAIDLSIALSLNPFLRMDGYWLAADLFGVWNLRALSVRTLRHFWAFLLRKPRSARNPLAALGGATASMVCVYSTLSVAFFVWLTAAMGYQVLFVLGPAYPGMVANAAHTVAAHPPGIAAILEVGWKSMLFIGCCMFIWRRLKAAASFGARRVAASRSRRAEIAPSVGEAR